MKDTQFVVRLSQEEKHQVLQALREEGMTFTGFVRKMLKKHFNITI